MYISTLSVLIVGVAEEVVVPTRLVILLFVSVFVEEIVGTTTPSTANTPAEERERVVSEALPSSIEPAVRALEVPRLRGTLEVSSPAECVRVALPLLKFTTAPEARNKSDHIKDVDPSARPSVVEGDNPEAFISTLSPITPAL